MSRFLSRVKNDGASTLPPPSFTAPVPAPVPIPVPKNTKKRVRLDPPPLPVAQPVPVVVAMAPDIIPTNRIAEAVLERLKHDMHIGPDKTIFPEYEQPECLARFERAPIDTQQQSQLNKIVRDSIDKQRRADIRKMDLEEDEGDKLLSVETISRKWIEQFLRQPATANRLELPCIRGREECISMHIGFDPNNPVTRPAVPLRAFMTPEEDRESRSREVAYRGMCFLCKLVHINMIVCASRSGTPMHPPEMAVTNFIVQINIPGEYIPERCHPLFDGCNLPGPVPVFRSHVWKWEKPFGSASAIAAEPWRIVEIQANFI